MSSLDTENAAALHQQRRQMYEQTDHYRNSYVDASTGLIRSEIAETRHCPVCGSVNSETLFVKNGGQYTRCSDCSMVFLNPVLQDDALAEYYRRNNVAQAAAHESESAFYRRIYTAGLDLLHPHAVRENLLDIGCSSGFFLDIARERGWVTAGVELNEQEVAIALGKGHEIWNGELAQLPPERRFTLITLWDVFEHIKNGVGYLTQLKGRLSPGGLVFLQIPSADSLAARIMRQQCNMFDGIEHVNLYGESTIRRTAERAGFDVLVVESVIDELKPLFNFLSYEHPYEGSFQFQPQFDFLTPELVRDRKLGYKLQVLLRPTDGL